MPVLKLLPFLAAAVALAPNGCARKAADGATDTASGPTMCTMLYAYGIGVTVVDSATGDSIRSGATLIARDGAYADTVRQGEVPSSFATLSTAGERPGTYSLTVLKDGYQPWERDGVKVTKDECHVLPVAVTAKLQRKR